MKTVLPVLALSFSCWLPVTAFAQAEAKDKAHQAHEAAAPTQAVAVLLPTEGSKVKGTITFTKTGGGIRVQGQITGLAPGKHGFHVHEFGDVTSPDGSSAGGHFNPTGAPHGGPDAEKRHAGDFGNVEADQSGTAKVEFEDKLITLEGAKSILGRGLVVHAKADDLKSQPSGDAGARVAVGVIGVGKAGTTPK